MLFNNVFPNLISSFPLHFDMSAIHWWIIIINYLIMKKLYLQTKHLLLLILILSGSAVMGQTLEITSGDLEVDPKSSTEISATYKDSTGAVVSDAKIKWHTEPGYLGKVDKYGALIANHPGEGFLIAKYKELRDSVVLKVTGTPKGGDDDADENDDEDYPKVKIVPSHIKVEINDSVELRAFYVDSMGVKIDTTFMWSLSPVELGYFNDPTMSMLNTNEQTGQGVVIASLGELADTAKLTVYESKAKKEKKEKEKAHSNGKQVIIEPGDMMVYVGHDDIQYNATLKNNGKKFENAEFNWSISDTAVATIDENGMVSLTGETGMTLVSAKYDKFKASVELLVVDSTVDMEVNTIMIHKVMPDGSELKSRTLKEGQSYKIGGLPYPLNILNAGMLHFPYGCIDEDIEIFMFIPEEYAETCDTCAEVTFSDDIISGVKFSVKPLGSDTIIEPYYFNIPVNLSLVFKQGLFNSLGITPEELDVFFAEDSMFVELADGRVAVDTIKNKIYANIEHFSTIVVKQKNTTTSAKEIAPVPDGDLDIYPNPFTNSTTIQFSLKQKSSVELEIFNLFGQKVNTLANREFEEGIHKIRWNGKDMNESPATTGIYICRFIKDGKISQVKKLIINR